jgi:hypothetical protein
LHGNLRELRGRAKQPLQEIRKKYALNCACVETQKQAVSNGSTKCQAELGREKLACFGTAQTEPLLHGLT